MIEDIIFDLDIFILEKDAITPGVIESYSMDGANYDYEASNPGDSSSIFIN